MPSVRVPLIPPSCPRLTDPSSAGGTAHCRESGAADGSGWRVLGRAATCTYARARLQLEGGDVADRWAAVAIRCVRILLEAGADAAAKDSHGWTVLHRLAMYGPDSPTVARLLLAAGCNLAATLSGAETAHALAKRRDRPRVAAVLEAAANEMDRSAAEGEADRLARAKQALPQGTRICVTGHGRGTCTGSHPRARGGLFRSRGGMEHTIAFDSGETAVVNLEKVAWAVKSAEMDAMDPPRPLRITVTTIMGERTELEVQSSVRPNGWFRLKSRCEVDPAKCWATEHGPWPQGNDRRQESGVDR